VSLLLTKFTSKSASHIRVVSNDHVTYLHVQCMDRTWYYSMWLDSKQDLHECSSIYTHTETDTGWLSLATCSTQRGRGVEATRISVMMCRRGGYSSSVVCIVNTCLYVQPAGLCLSPCYYIPGLSQKFPAWYCWKHNTTILTSLFFYQRGRMASRKCT